MPLCFTYEMVVPELDEQVKAKRPSILPPAEPAAGYVIKLFTSLRQAQGPVIARTSLMKMLMGYHNAIMQRFELDCRLNILIYQY